VKVGEGAMKEADPRRVTWAMVIGALVLILLFTIVLTPLMTKL